MSPVPLASSFRDPAGYVFLDNGVYKRIITMRGKPDYDLLLSSGLYRELTQAGLLLSHAEENAGFGRDAAEECCAASRPNIYKLIGPEQLDYISYPYEWSFSQLKDAALLTLDVQRRALRRGMSLKDASGFNVQFRGAKPVFIDTLSFERNTGGPWVAYDQFCRHFLAPLLFMAYVDPGYWIPPD